MNYAVFQGICQFARVFYMCVISPVHMLERYMSLGSFLKAAGFSRAAGSRDVSLVPSRHERSPRGFSASGGQLWGDFPPQVPIHRESESERSVPLNHRVRKHATCARIARTPGHSLYYLIITVPIDTILIINDLQIFSSKRWWHFVLF